MLRSIDYELSSDGQTITKLTDNTVPFEFVHAISRYDFMVEAYDLENSLNRNTEKGKKERLCVDRGGAYQVGKR